MLLEIGELIQNAFHLRRSIDSLKDGQMKHQLTKKYAKIIWKIQDYYRGG